MPVLVEQADGTLASFQTDAEVASERYDNMTIPNCVVEDVDPTTPMGARFRKAITAATGDNADARSLLIAVREALPEDDTLLTVWDVETGVPVLLVGPVG